MFGGKFTTTLIAITGVILFVSILASLFFLFYNHAAILGMQTNQTQTFSLQPTVHPSPKPTPLYEPYLKREPNYVGVVESIDLPRQVTLVRPDQSRVVLDLQPGIPIFVVDQTNFGYVKTTATEILALGDSVSVYTSGRDIVAVFALK